MLELSLHHLLIIHSILARSITVTAENALRKETLVSQVALPTVASSDNVEEIEHTGTAEIDDIGKKY